MSTTSTTALPTVAGAGFAVTGLADYKPPAGYIGVPGLGKAATKALAEKGIHNHRQLFGRFMLADGDRAAFFAYLEDEVGVKFVGGPSGTQEDSRDRLWIALETVWNKIKHY